MIDARRLRELVNYNPQTGEFRWAVARTGPAKAGTLAGRLESKGYRQISIDGRRYMAHRLAWLYTHGEWPAEEIDHINGVRDDNSIANLRPVSRAMNMRNKRRYCTARSPWPGVSQARSGAWYATLGHGGYIGSYNTLEAAIAARRAAEAEAGYHANHGRR